ncbi:MAG: FxLYD domain-containing protein [Candidatus Hydrogenedens sp.]
MVYYYRIIIGVILLLYLGNCQGNPFIKRDKDFLNLSHRNLYNTNTTFSEIKLAQQLIEKGQFSQALPKLLSVIESGEKDTNAFYFLGVVYQELGSPQNALSYYIKYLQLAPQGVYAEHSRKQIGTLIGSPINHIEKVDTIENQIRMLEQKLQQEPQNIDIMLQLANWYWINQNFSKAGNLYKSIISLDSNYWSHPVISSRLEKGANGEIVVLTPEEALKREAEKNPIVFFNVTSFRSGRSLGWSSDFKHHIYNVSGQVRNRSSRTLRNVTVQLTIYGFSGVVYDTQTITLGNLSSGQIKPFSAQFVNFDNIENVDHYDYMAYYDE